MCVYRLLKTFAVVFMTALFLCCAGLSVGAYAGDSCTPTYPKVDAVRWFPCPEQHRNNDIWEVQCTADGGYQRFTDCPEETGNTNFLDTVYEPDGSLTLRRNGADPFEDAATIRIQTLPLEQYNDLDIFTADTLYMDISAIDCSWTVSLSFAAPLTYEKYTLSLTPAIVEAHGVTVSQGRRQGSLHLPTLLHTLAAQGSAADAEAASAILQLQNTQIPQLTVGYTGDMGGSLTLHKLFISTADDPQGTLCADMSMDLLFGDTDCHFPASDDAYLMTSTTVATTTTARTQADVAQTIRPSAVVFAVCGAGLAVLLSAYLVHRRRRARAAEAPPTDGG